MGFPFKSPVAWTRRCPLREHQIVRWVKKTVWRNNREATGHISGDASYNSVSHSFSFQALHFSLACSMNVQNNCIIHYSVVLTCGTLWLALLCPEKNNIYIYNSWVILSLGHSHRHLDRSVGSQCAIQSINQPVNPKNISVNQSINQSKTQRKGREVPSQHEKIPQQ